MPAFVRGRRWDFAVTLQFSAEAQEALAGLSVEGQAYLIRSLEPFAGRRSADNHVHAGGMCCLLEAGESGCVLVTRFSPVCLEPK
jgi:hypothetical protein